MFHSKLSVVGDEVVYQRTRAGARELLSGMKSLSAVERRMLAVFTGYTPVRTVVELINAPGIPAAIEHLLKAGLIELASIPVQTVREKSDPLRTFW